MEDQVEKGLNFIGQDGEISLKNICFILILPLEYKNLQLRNQFDNDNDLKPFVSVLDKLIDKVVTKCNEEINEKGAKFYNHSEDSFDLIPITQVSTLSASLTSPSPSIWTRWRGFVEISRDSPSFAGVWQKPCMSIPFD